MKITIFLSLMILLALQSMAQNEILDNNATLTQYLQQSKFDIDPNAQAVILHEKGRIIMVDGRMSFKISRTIKLLGKDAISYYGTINISRDEDESLSDISGTTYNYENGKIVRQKVERSDILNDKITKGLNVFKFNLPALKEGSIIHYTYILERPESIFIPDWAFQNEYPTLYSEYEIKVPSNILYTSIERVNVPFVKAKKSKELESCQACSYEGSFSPNEGFQTWVRRNIPAFEEEPYMSSPQNYIERVKVHITGVISRGVVTNIYKDWNDFSKKYYYKNDDFCGQVFNNNSFLKEKTEELTVGKTTELDKAKAIFSYVRDNHTVKETGRGIKASGNIKDIFTEKTGTDDGINFLLIAMLRKAGLNSDPILLSTRSKERLNPLYPSPRNINYVAGRLTIDKKEYLLDASEKQTPFGYLKPECYNGYCRVVNEQGAGMELEPDMLLNKSTCIINVKPGKENNLSMSFDKNFGAVSGIEKRKEWLDDTAGIKRDIIRALNKLNLPATLNNYTVKNLDDPDGTLAIHYEADIKLDNKVSTIYFDPYFTKFFAKNPFVSKSRKYAIEMDYKEDINYVFRLQLPEGFTVEDYPKSAILKYRENETMLLKNIMDFDEEGKIFSLNSRFTTKSTLFAAEEYNDIRSFYENMMTEQNKKIVLKKIN